MSWLKGVKFTKRTNIYLVTFLILLAALWAAALDFPTHYNNTANYINEKQSVVTIPQINRTYVLGLDLQGGVQLIYEAQFDKVASVGDQDEKMQVLRDRIERRVNALGVSEPRVQVQQDTGRLIVELAGIKDPNQAIQQIGSTPFLEFKEPREQAEQEALLRAVAEKYPDLGITEETIPTFCQSAPPQFIALIVDLNEGTDPCFSPTNLTGEFLERADVVSDPTTGRLQISLQFNKEGASLFEDITERNLGDVVAIYLDGFPISAPQVQQKITGGEAVITGDFSLEEARELVRGLNDGALPVPIELISQQQVGASLGAESLSKSLTAGAIALVVVLAFLIVVYRFSGLLAVFSLLTYLVFLLALIKLIPVTLTLAGVAGLILSLGMAVDANILVFERLREELKEKGVENVALAVENAYARAWPSVRDGNISTLLTAAILFFFSTSFIQGFALVLGLGILISMFSAMVITKYFMKTFLTDKLNRAKWLWSR